MTRCKVSDPWACSMCYLTVWSFWKIVAVIGTLDLVFMIVRNANFWRKFGYCKISPPGSRSWLLEKWHELLQVSIFPASVIVGGRIITRRIQSRELLMQSPCLLHFGNCVYLTLESPDAIWPRVSSELLKKIWQVLSPLIGSRKQEDFLPESVCSATEWLIALHILVWCSMGCVACQNTFRSPQDGHRTWS